MGRFHCRFVFGGTDNYLNSGYMCSGERKMMGEKRHIKDFRIPGKVRYKERNPRGKNAEWLEFACSKSETDTIMGALGTAIQQTAKCELPAGTLLARICREWLKTLKG